MADELAIELVEMGDEDGTGACALCGAQCLGFDDPCRITIGDEPVCSGCAEANE